MFDAPAWCAAYIGLPYLKGGRNRAGCDCWGLVVIVLAEQFGYRPPAYEGVEWSAKGGRDHHASVGGLIASEAAAHWTPIEPGQEQPGDVIVLRICGQPLHCGVVIGGRHMLHTAEEADATIEPYDGLVWRNRVVGFWRHAEADGADDNDGGDAA